MEDNNHNSTAAAELTEPDVQILTSGGLRIPAHSSILAKVSPVLENIMRCQVKRVIPVLGVPCDAVSAFIEYLYNSTCTEEQMEKYGIHLLVLWHVYLVPRLKQRCTRGVSERLTVENVVDVLQLARLCDAPDLYLKCLKQVAGRFNSVEKTEGWKIMQDHDPWLELEILKFIDEAESRKKRTRRHKKEQSLYLQLSDGIECLEHICREGCTTVRPYNAEPTMKPIPCDKYNTCEGVQMLIKHFALCKRRADGFGCCRCKRMWQLLRLHSSICDHPDSCRVPLCRQFKSKAQRHELSNDAKWKLLEKKVLSAKAMSSLYLSKRKRKEELMETRGISAQALKTIRLC